MSDGDGGGDERELVLDEVDEVATGELCGGCYAIHSGFTVSIVAFVGSRASCWR